VEEEGGDKKEEKGWDEWNKECMETEQEV